jgi:sterol desaturase/sphingolipid hydroxylase (fatty acid hydroxylase superfamily)
MKPRKILGFDYDPIYARFHRAHHREPWSPDWVLVPVRFIVLGFFVSGALFWAVLPTLSLAATAWFAFCVMGVLYEWSHLLVHTRYKPKSKFFREIWRNHRLHHFKNESYWFGLSGTLADTVLGTAPDHSKVETSDTVRTLGVGDETGEQ